MEIIQILVLVCAMSADTFASSLAYSAKGIKILKSSCIVLNLVCALVVGFGVEMGRVTLEILSFRTVTVISSIILGMLGFSNIFESVLKAGIKNSTKRDFHIFDFHFILEIICDTTQADSDFSKTLSAREACTLALALSLDGFVAGVSAGMWGISSLALSIITFLVGSLATLSGGLFGKKISEHRRANMSWISGIILLILAFLKLK